MNKRASWNVQICLLLKKNFVISVEEHARFVNLFVLLFVCIITVYLLKLVCSATVPLWDTIVLSWSRHIRLTSIDASKWYWDVNSLYRKMTFPKCSAPVCSCIVLSIDILYIWLWHSAPPPIRFEEPHFWNFRTQYLSWIMRKVSTFACEERTLCTLHRIQVRRIKS